MSTEVLYDYDTHCYSFYVPENQIKYIYEKGNEAPRLIVRSRNKIGVDIVVGNDTLHLPCFLEDSDHLLHAMEFKLRDKTVLIRVF